MPCLAQQLQREGSTGQLCTHKNNLNAPRFRTSQINSHILSLFTQKGNVSSYQHIPTSQNKSSVVVQHIHTTQMPVSHQPIRSFSRALGSNLDPGIRPCQPSKKRSSDRKGKFERHNNGKRPSNHRTPKRIVKMTTRNSMDIVFSCKHAPPIKTPARLCISAFWFCPFPLPSAKCSKVFFRSGPGRGICYSVGFVVM